MCIPFFRLEEIFTISKKHILNARLENDGAHGPFLPSTVPSPTAVCSARQDQIYDKDLHDTPILRITQKYMNTMFGIFLILPLCF